MTIPTTCADPENLVRGGGGGGGLNLVTFSFVVVFFLVDEGKGVSKYNFKRSTMTFRWHTDDDPALNAGLVIL